MREYDGKEVWNDYIVRRKRQEMRFMIARDIAIVALVSLLVAHLAGLW